MSATSEKERSPRLMLQGISSDRWKMRCKLSRRGREEKKYNHEKELGNEELCRKIFKVILLY